MGTCSSRGWKRLWPKRPTRRSAYVSRANGGLSCRKCDLHAGEHATSVPLQDDSRVHGLELPAVVVDPHPPFHSTPAQVSSVDQAAICVRSSLSSPMRRPLRHWRVIAPDSHSATLNQLPCFGVGQNSIRRPSSLARSGSNAA